MSDVPLIENLEEELKDIFVHDAELPMVMKIITQYHTELLQKIPKHKMRNETLLLDENTYSLYVKLSDLKNLLGRK